MKKKILCLVLVLTFIFTMLVSCDKNNDDADDAGTAVTTTTVNRQDNDNHVDAGDL